jgi:peptide deformylase
MKIVSFPHKSLFTKTQPVTVFGPELKVLLDRMYEIMASNKGIGLAANQVELTFRMFVMQGPDGPIYLVNPRIVWESKANASIREGCLSAPAEFVVLGRSAIVKVEYQDETGEKKTKIFNDIYAVCVQHEIEHLDGKSFMHHKSLTKVQKKQLQAKWGIK